MKKLLLVLLLAAACGPTQTTPAPPLPDAPPTWHRDVQPLVEKRCQGCHVTGGIAPIRLSSFADAVQWKDAMRSAIEARRMPPYLAGRTAPSTRTTR